MRKLILIVSLCLASGCLLWGQMPSQQNEASVLSQRQQDSLTFVGADWKWTSLAKDAEVGYASLPIFGSTQSISVVRYRASKFKTSLVSAPASESSTTDTLAMRSGALAAVNGSYFNMKTLEHATFFCSGGKVLSKSYSNEIFRCDGVLALKKGCSHEIEVLTYSQADEPFYSKRYKAAIVSGPVLLLDGQRRGDFNMKNKFFRGRHPRTFVGQTSDGWIYFVVIDGRFPGQGDGATIPEVVTIAAWFGLSDAINLDGGGSSTLWTSSTGVVNHPYDNKKFDHEGLRVVPNIVTVSK